MGKPPWYRSISATIKNQSGHTLTLIEPVPEFDWGQWGTPDLQPPASIKTIAHGAEVKFFVENDCIGLDGVEATIEFRVVGDEVDDKTPSKWVLYFDNPWCGTNEYKQNRLHSKTKPPDGDAIHQDKVDDDEAVVRFICYKEGDVPETQGKAGDNKAPEEHVCTAQGEGCHISAPGKPVSVVIVCDIATEPTEELSRAYYFLRKWGEAWAEAGKARDENRCIQLVPVEDAGGRVLSADERKDMRKRLKDNILQAYRDAVAKQCGQGGEIVHAIGHGVILTGTDEASTGKKWGQFDLGAQLGGFSQHVLVISDATFDNSLHMPDQSGTVRPLTDAQKAEEAENLETLAELGKILESGSAAGKYTGYRIITCRLGETTYLAQRVVEQIKHDMWCYEAHLMAGHDAEGRWQIGVDPPSGGPTDFSSGVEIPTRLQKSVQVDIFK